VKARRVFYSGRVQGVGFRWTTRDLAAEFEVCGTVRNLSDGRVELIVAGYEATAFLNAIRDSVLAGHIDTVEEEELELEKLPKGFTIVP